MAVGSVRHRVRLHLQSTTIQGDSKLADTMNRSLNGHNPSLANIPYLHCSIRIYSYMPVCVLWGETNTKTYVIYMWASLSPFRSTWRVNCHGARDGVCVLKLHFGAGMERTQTKASSTSLKVAGAMYGLWAHGGHGMKAFGPRQTACTDSSQSGYGR